jgi:hypothetical protein
MRLSHGRRLWLVLFGKMNLRLAARRGYAKVIGDHYLVYSTRIFTVRGDALFAQMGSAAASLLATPAVAPSGATYRLLAVNVGGRMVVGSAARFLPCGTGTARFVGKLTVQGLTEMRTETAAHVNLRVFDGA